jgi:tetratricopeptide (TPR) repeat protein
VAHNFPVIVETWVVRDAQDQLGHYLLIVGYDDVAQQFLTYDSLHGPDVPIGYQELDELWRVFNRLYLIIVPPASMPDLMAVLGPAAREAWATAHALDVARMEAANPPETCVAYAACTDAETFAYFNIGTNLVAQGHYEQAVAAYDQARLLGLHYRMLWYQFGPYAAYYAVGRYEDVITLADETLRVTRNLEESYYWRGRAWQALGEIQKARADFKAALRYHEGWPPAQEALEALEE